MALSESELPLPGVPAFQGEHNEEIYLDLLGFTRAEYDAHIAELKAKGQSGKLETGRIVTTGNAGGNT